MKDLSPMFLIIDDLFTVMHLGNPLEVVVYRFLIGGMTNLVYRDGFPMVSALVCMVKH